MGVSEISGFSTKICFFFNGEHDDEIASEFFFFVFFLTDTPHIYIYIHTYIHGFAIFMEQRYQRIDEASSELGPLGTELIQFLDRPIPVSKEFGSRLSPTFSMGYTPVFPSYIYINTLFQNPVSQYPLIDNLVTGLSTGSSYWNKRLLSFFKLFFRPGSCYRHKQI